jgi:hypothetical protein
MHWVVTSPEDMAVLEEVNKGASDRAIGIIAASLVEIHLTKLIKLASRSRKNRTKRLPKSACFSLAALSVLSLRRFGWLI